MILLCMLLSLTVSAFAGQFTPGSYEATAQGGTSEPAGTALADGVYTGEGNGFNLTAKIPVTVEVKDGKIASVEVGENGETMGFIAAVVNTFIPRMIDRQSLAVDALTGAPYIYSTCGTDSMGVLFNENKVYTNYGGCAQSYCFVSGREAAAYAAAQILADTDSH